MTAKEYLKQGEHKTLRRVLTEEFLILSVQSIMESYYQLKSKEEAEKRYKAVSKLWGRCRKGKP